MKAAWRMVGLVTLAACTREPSPANNQTAAEPLPYRAASASEVFNLRSKCADLGRKIDEDNFHGPALTVEITTHYNLKTNRCYVERNASAVADDHVARQSMNYLYDGQTGEMLAYAGIDHGKPRAMILSGGDFASRDSEKGLPPAEQAMDFINDAMADDRKS